MLIACKFHRPNAPVTIDDRTYFFRPINPADPQSEHVCEVADKAHAQRFMGIPEGYLIAEGELPVAQRPDATKPVPALVTVEPTTTKEPAGPVVVPEAEAADAETVEQATALLEHNWQKILPMVKAGDIPTAVLTEALRLEQAKDADDVRSSVVKALTHALAV